jgi:hypothetical protein
MLNVQFGNDKIRNVKFGNDKIRNVKFGNDGPTGLEWPFSATVIYGGNSLLYARTLERSRI